MALGQKTGDEKGAAEPSGPVFVRPSDGKQCTVESYLRIKEVGDKYPCSYVLTGGEDFEAALAAFQHSRVDTLTAALEDAIALIGVALQLGSGVRDWTDSDIQSRTAELVKVLNGSGSEWVAELEKLFLAVKRPLLEERVYANIPPYLITWWSGVKQSRDKLLTLAPTRLRFSGYPE